SAPPAPALFLFLFVCSRPHRDLPSFPTRRSSDLSEIVPPGAAPTPPAPSRLAFPQVTASVIFPLAETLTRNASSPPTPWPVSARDRKSTRLNSSHVEISYAVLCLKKKRKKKRRAA